MIKYQKMLKKYYTLKNFEEIKKEQFPLVLGRNLILVSNVQLNIHNINVPTYPHFHKDYQILYYLRGSGYEKIENKKINVVPGITFLIPPLKKHSFTPDVNTEAQIFALRFRIKKNIIKKRNTGEKREYKIMNFLFSEKSYWWTLSSSRKEELEGIIKKLSEIITKKELGWVIEIEGFFYLIFRLFFISYFEVKGRKIEKLTKKEKIFLKIQDYIKEKIEGEIRSSDIAKELMLSQRYVQKIVKEFTGYSFTNFLNIQRIEKAKELLLKNQDFQIKYIAHKCGFKNINYFSRLFKKIEGVSPTEYREIS